MRENHQGLPIPFNHPPAGDKITQGHFRPWVICREVLHFATPPDFIGSYFFSLLASATIMSAHSSMPMELLSRHRS